jgi:hypothetical protein
MLVILSEAKNLAVYLGVVVRSLPSLGMTAFLYW